MEVQADMDDMEAAQQKTGTQRVPLPRRTLY